MKKQLKTCCALSLILVVLAVGCKRAPDRDIQPKADNTATSSSQVSSRATPYANGPAAGICAEGEGEIVLMTINPDIPDPRCMIVKPDQKLRIMNNTQDMIDVTLGTFRISLEAGAAGVLDKPLGEYLEPGVHVVLVSKCCGGEIWLKRE